MCVRVVYEIVYNCPIIGFERPKIPICIFNPDRRDSQHLISESAPRMGEGKTRNGMHDDNDEIGTLATLRIFFRKNNHGGETTVVSPT